MKQSPTRRRFILVAAAFLFLFLLNSISAADQTDKKFLWKLTSSKNTVYLMGSIHLLNKDSYPMPAPFEKAYQECSSLVFETNIDKMDSQETQGLILKNAILPPDQSLSRMISKDTYQLLEKRLSSSGVDITQLDRLSPWMWAITLTVLELHKLGFDPQYGLDRHFFNKAKNDGKKIMSLESVEEQLQLFFDLEPDKQDSLLKKTLKELEITKRLYNEMIQAWRSGDTDKLYTIVVKSFEGHPDILKKMLLDRNEKWVKEIESLIVQNEKALIVVGAAHLSGPDSMVTLLSKKGYYFIQQ